MKTLKIGGKNYTLEYCFEAVANEDCVEKVIKLFDGMSKAGNKEEVTETVKQIVGLPTTTISMFYAGLIENHGQDGDGTVLGSDEARKLLKLYFKENKDANDGNFYGMMQTILDCMGDDGFFKQIGLDFEEEKNQPKTPTDHKPKATKASKK